MTTEQISVWTGAFGREYTERNRFDDDALNRLYQMRYGRTRDDINQDWLGHLPRDIRILEVGANIGNQLRALQRLGFKQLYGIEIQRYCVDEAKKLHPGIDIVEASGFDIPFKDRWFDLVFTNNVLIHIAPDDLPRLLSEIHRVSRDYVMGMEYYAAEVTEISYHGHTNLLWKADYAALYRKIVPALVTVREELFPMQDEPGKMDKMFLLRRK